MWERYSIIGAVFALTIILLDFHLLRKRKIQGKGFVFWFTVGAVLGSFSIVPSLFHTISIVLGTEFTVSAILMAGFLFFILAIFYLHYKITELHGLLMKLTMEISLIRHGQKQAERGTANPKSRNSTMRKDKNERKASSSRRKTSV